MDGGEPAWQESFPAVHASLRGLYQWQIGEPRKRKGILYKLLSLLMLTSKWALEEQGILYRYKKKKKTREFNNRKEYGEHPPSSSWYTPACQFYVDGWLLAE